ncbi:S41 family peptidase [Sporosalibacterium faouarense]|uniref:S41 family peptidase n=1 Tax=Sporosalibacterium faouarense TaxID=516123 RepID=UPI00141C58B1|nr:S41 family peptidase [Sporosalibacterium faouarense]MTI46933.1 hypothetical protein [Bacillota bacterium]
MFTEFKNMYVLVDGHSASGSEIVALELKEYLENATIIGMGITPDIYVDSNSIEII